MIAVGLLVMFALLGIVLAVVAYSSNQRKRAGQNHIEGNRTNGPTVARPTSDLN
jgi:hypothetical protein